MPRGLETALEVTLRNRFAENLAKRPAEEVCLRYAACSSDGMKKTLQLAERHEHGEHEYRLREWEDAFSRAGLRIGRNVEFHPRISFRGGIKGLVSLLPSSVRDLLYQTENATPRTTWRYVAQQLRQLTAGRRSRILGAHRDTMPLIRKPN